MRSSPWLKEKQNRKCSSMFIRPVKHRQSDTRTGTHTHTHSRAHTHKLRESMSEDDNQNMPCISTLSECVCVCGCVILFLSPKYGWVVRHAHTLTHTHTCIHAHTRMNFHTSDAYTQTHSTEISHFFFFFCLSSFLHTSLHRHTNVFYIHSFRCPWSMSQSSTPKSLYHFNLCSE